MVTSCVAAWRNHAEDEAPLSGQRGNWAPLNPAVMNPCCHWKIKIAVVDRHVLVLHSLGFKMKMSTKQKISSILPVLIILTFWFFKSFEVCWFNLPCCVWFVFVFYRRGKWSRKDRSQQVHNAIHCCYHQSQSESRSWKVSCCCAQIGLVTKRQSIIREGECCSVDLC